MQYNLTKHTIDFDEPTHTYKVQDKQLVSVTTLLNQLEKPFDMEGMALKCSQNKNHKLYGKSPAEIKQIWREYNNNSKERGKMFHLFAESVIKNETEKFYQNHIPDRLRTAFFTYWKNMNIITQVNIVGLEQMMAMPEVGICGTCDALFHYDAHGLYIFDWKTNEKFTTDEPYFLLKPFDHLDKSKHTTYTLQTYIYKYILEEEYGIEIKGTRIVWLNESAGVVPYKPKFAYDRVFIRNVIDVCLERHYKLAA